MKYIGLINGEKCLDTSL